MLVRANPRRIGRGGEASCAQVDRNEASDIKLAPAPVDISIYLYLLTSNMCNVPAPLQQRRRRRQRARLRFRGYAAPPRAARKPPISSSIKSPSVGVTYNVSFVTVEHTSSWARKGVRRPFYCYLCVRRLRRMRQSNANGHLREEPCDPFDLSCKWNNGFFFLSIC